MKLATDRNLPRAFLILLLIVVIANIVLIAPYLLALFFGWILSTVLKPMYNHLLERKWKPERAALLGVMVSIFTIIIPITGFGFALVKNLIRIIGPYTKTGINIDAWITKVYEWPLGHRFFESEAEIRAFVDENSRKVVSQVANQLSAIFSAAPEIALQLVLALLATYFILVDGKRFCDWMRPRIPLPPETRAHLSKSLSDTAYSSFLSMLAAALAQSLIVFIGFLVLNVPFAPLALGIGFVTAWFPIFGVTPVWGAGLVYLLIDGRVGAAIGMLAFGIVASLIDNIVRPWVLKGRGDMHPLISLVAIFGGIVFFGIPGVLVGPVVVSFAIEVLRVWPTFAREIGLTPEDAES